MPYSPTNSFPDKEPARFLPVLFVCTIIFALWAIYNFVHILPLLQLDRPTAVRREMAQRGWIELVIFNALFAMLLVCYTLCVVTTPGEIPNTENWLYNGGGEDEPVGADLSGLDAQEKKRSGERRHCKWCGKFKPDRCHHCRVCKRCVLKMDHHCPWIYNCVGFRNHKYFFLLLFYATLTAHFVWITMIESTRYAVEEEEPLGRVFLLVFGMVLSSLFGLLLTVFFAFHIWLAFKAMTTIEYCEKSSKKQDYTGSIYHRGCYGDFVAVVGPNPFFWLLPIAYGRGDGMTFTSNNSERSRKVSVTNSYDKHRVGSDGKGEGSSRSTLEVRSADTKRVVKYREEDEQRAPESSEPLL